LLEDVAKKASGREAEKTREGRKNQVSRSAACDNGTGRRSKKERPPRSCAWAFKEDAEKASQKNQRIGTGKTSNEAEKMGKKERKKEKFVEGWSPA